MDQLVEIRCQKLKIKKRHGQEYEAVCNRLCIRVYPGSKGEAYCPSCDNRFNFDVARDNQSIYDILKTTAKPA